MLPVEPVLGLDSELANSLIVPGCADGRPAVASRMLLEAMPGYPPGPLTGTTMEFGRQWYANGGCAYIDTDHLEINVPTHRRSSEHALLYHAMLRRVRRAQRSVQRTLAPGAVLYVAANSSDGRTAWGSHLSVLVPRATFENLTCWKPHHASFFATHLVTSVLYTGQGMVGAGNKQPTCWFQLAQRPDFFVALWNNDTMVHRGIINTRDDPHCGPELARLHVIYYDPTLSLFAARLKAGTTQLLVAMLSENYLDLRLLLDNPVAAASEISRDLAGRTRFEMAVRGLRMTSLEIQQAIADLAGEFVAEGRAQHVPEAKDILADWHDVLDWLRRRDREALAARCDNWMKLTLLEHRLAKRGLSFTSPEAKVLDARFASLDPNEGLFWLMVGDGRVESMQPDELIEHYADSPPQDTRGYLRGKLLERFGPFVERVDWSMMEFRIPDAGCWSRIARLDMPDPREFGRVMVKPVLESSDDLNEIVDALHSLMTDPAPAVPAECN
jgi:proteasome accessory factor A